MNPMKNKLILLPLFFALCVVMLAPINGFSQAAKSTKAIPDSAHSFVKLDKINKYYTEGELNKLPKLALIEIYKSRLTYLVEILPFISLHPEPGSTFHDMSIPETEANIAHLDKEAKNKQAFIKSLSETLDDVIPYSEKTNIVWSILFFDEMIKKSDYKK
jgi:hypothetical protein